MNAKELGAQPANGWCHMVPEGLRVSSQGLTKRELFAAMALQGILSDNANSRGGIADISIADSLAAAAVCQADALLAELAKEQP